MAILLPYAKLPVTCIDRKTLMINDLWRRGRVWTTLLLAIGASFTPIAAPRPANAQSTCAAAHCLWTPLVATFTPVQITDSSNVPQGNQIEITGVVEATEQAVYDVQLQAKVFSQSDTLLQTLVITPVLAATLPGQSNPYYQRIAVCCAPAHAEVSLLSWHASSTRTYVTLPVSPLAWTSERFAVAVRNDRSVTLYHLVVAVRETFAEVHVGRLDALAPGKSFVYQEDTPDPWGFHFESWAQASLRP